MKCKSRGCHSERFHQSRKLKRYGFCPDCKNFSLLDEEDFPILESEGLLLYVPPPPEPEPEKPKKEAIVAKKGKSRKVQKDKPKKKAPSTPPKKKKAKPSDETPRSENPRIRTCKQHPEYGVMRAPRKDCAECWRAYANKHPDKAQKYMEKKA